MRRLRWLVVGCALTAPVASCSEDGSGPQDDAAGAGGAGAEAASGAPTQEQGGADTTGPITEGGGGATADGGVAGGGGATSNGGVAGDERGGEAGQAGAPAGGEAGEGGAGPEEASGSLAIGSQISCWLKKDGSPLCWGDNARKQVVDVAGPLASLVAGGDDHLCGLQRDGTPVCWGSSASPPAGAKFKRLSAASGYTCGIRLDDTVACWGGFAQFTREQNEAPLAGKYKAISVASFVCGIRLDDTLVCAKGSVTIPGEAEWSTGTFRAVGGGTFGGLCGIRTDGTLKCWGNSIAWAPAGTFKAVAAGNGLACAITDADKLVCNNGYAPAGTFTDVGLNEENVCVLPSGGSPICFGRDYFGEGTVPGAPFTSVVAGIGFYCGLRSDHSVSCWGSGAPSKDPTPKFATIYGGGILQCGIEPNGKSECWGNDPFNVTNFPNLQPATSFGLGSGGACLLQTDGQARCTHLYMPGTFTAVDASEGYACGIQLDGSLLCKGVTNTNPNLPDPVPPPTLPPPPGAFTALSAEGTFACALRTNGKVACWGDNSSGQSSPPNDVFTAVLARQISGQTNPTGKTVYVGCGLTPGGDVTCWGDKNHALSRSGPFTSIAGNSDRICAVAQQGHIECWGGPAVVSTHSFNGVFASIVR